MSLCFLGSEEEHQSSSNKKAVAPPLSSMSHSNKSIHYPKIPCLAASSKCLSVTVSAPHPAVPQLTEIESVSQVAPQNKMTITRGRQEEMEKSKPHPPIEPELSLPRSGLSCPQN